MQEPHVVDRHAAEQVSELAPDDEQCDRVPEVLAQPEQVRVSQGRVLLGVVRDRDLVRVDLHRQRGNPDHVERREGQHQAERRQQVDPRRERELLVERSPDEHQRDEPEQADPQAEAVGRVQHQRDDPD